MELLRIATEEPEMVVDARRQRFLDELRALCNRQLAELSAEAERLERHPPQDGPNARVRLLLVHAGFSRAVQELIGNHYGDDS